MLQGKSDEVDYSMAGSTLVDRLYEAALVPELWSDACESLATEVGATVSILAIDHHGTYRFVTTPAAAEFFDKFRASDASVDNVRPARIFENAPFSFSRDRDLLTPEEMANDRGRRFLLSNGYDAEALWAFREPSGHLIGISFLRKTGLDHFSDSDLTRLNALKPDLARSAYMASRLAFREARSMSEMMSRLGLPAAVIGDDGQVEALNPEMEALAPRIKTGAGDRLVLDGAANTMLSDAIERFRAQAVPVVQSLPMISRDGKPSLILHLMPVRRAARDIFSRSMAILVVTAVGEVGPPDMRVLSGLFDLTPAEARVARGIAKAQSPETIAANLGISIQTARSHLKRIMSKTATTRQAELVLLLSGMGLPGGGIL